MGLRILSVGSLLADSASVVHLFTQDLTAASSVHSLLWVAGAVLPAASAVALYLWQHLEKPSVEAVRQLAAFEAHLLHR